MWWTLRSTFLFMLLYIYGSESIPNPDKLTVNLNIDEKQSVAHHHHPGNRETGRSVEDSESDYFLEKRPYVRGRPDPGECGRENSGGGAVYDYISGGERVPPHKYPWMVHMLGMKDDGNVTHCGGSLISDTVVLTALHCVEHRKSWREADFGVKVGVADIRANQHQIIKPKTGLWPRQSRGVQHDIAILILERPVDLSDPNVGTICLPAKGKENDIKGRNALALGWGNQYNMSTPSHLKQVELKVASLDDLRPKQEKLFMFTEIDRINGIPQDPCGGDSGGPLQYKEDGHWTIVGALKGRGYNCGRRTFSDEFHGLGQWNKLTPHLDWIRCVMKDANNCNSRRRDW